MTDESEPRPRAPRRRTLFGGILVFGEGEQTLNCSIRDLSANGARIRVPSLGHIRSPTILLIPSLDQAYEVDLAWGKGLEFGLTFLRPANLTSPGTDLERSARRLWLLKR